jgi:hypothetical protein
MIESLEKELKDNKLPPRSRKEIEKSIVELKKNIKDLTTVNKIFEPQMVSKLLMAAEYFMMSFSVRNNLLGKNVQEDFDQIARACLQDSVTVKEK